MSSLLSLISDIPAQSLSNSAYFTKSHESPLTSTKTVQNLLGAAMLYDRMVTDWEADGIGKLKSLRAIFDIRWDDGEEVKWVLTPYDQKSERLPHAEARAMSMSWVVEPTGDCPDENEGVREVLRTMETAKGMWRFMDLPFTQYLLV